MEYSVVHAVRDRPTVRVSETGHACPAFRQQRLTLVFEVYMKGYIRCTWMVHINGLHEKFNPLGQTHLRPILPCWKSLQHLLVSFSSCVSRFLAPENETSGTYLSYNLYLLSSILHLWYYKNNTKIPDFLQFFQPTANCFISSSYCTVLRPRKWTIMPENVRKTGLSSSLMWSFSTPSGMNVIHHGPWVKYRYIISKLNFSPL